MVPFEPPVEPNGPEAQQWLLNELAKPEYQAAKPSWFDLASQAFNDWLGSLFQNGSGVSGVFAIVGGVIVVGIIVAAFIIFGLPRLNRRQREQGTVLATSDRRTAAQMRSAAESAARSGDLQTAIIEMFRALSQGLVERTIVSVTPGTTAREVAMRARSAFPDQAERLDAAASAFDGVRYLGRRGEATAYDELDRLESELRTLRPRLDALREPVPAG